MGPKAKEIESQVAFLGKKEYIMEKDEFWLIVFISILLIWVGFDAYKFMSADTSPDSPESQSWANGVHAICVGTDKIYKFGDDIEVISNHKDCLS